MYPLPSGTAITSDLAQRLDDKFFTGDPSGHLRARLRALLVTDSSIDGPLTDRVGTLLGPAMSLLTDIDPRTVKMQISVDALALRHQTAEALLRLLHGVLHHETTAENSVWVALTDSPTSMRTVIKQNQDALTSGPEEAYERLGQLLLPADGSGTGVESSAGAEALDESRAIHIEWVNYAIRLMMQRDPDINAAQNKLKHGLAMRAQDDHLLAFTMAPPNDDETMEAEVLNGSDTAAILDGVTAEFLARPQKHGLQLTQMRTDPSAIIAEAGALILTHALLFHQAATRHFAEREVPLGRRIPGFPGRFVGGPRPGQLRANRPFALRFQLTFPVHDGSTGKPVLFWADGSMQDLTFGPKQQVRVVDSSSD